MGLRRLEKVLVWQSEFRRQSTYPGEPTYVICLGLGDCGYILKRSLALPPITENCHPQLA